MESDTALRKMTAPERKNSAKLLGGNSQVFTCRTSGSSRRSFMMLKAAKEGKRSSLSPNGVPKRGKMCAMKPKDTSPTDRLTYRSPVKMLSLL